MAASLSALLERLGVPSAGYVHRGVTDYVGPAKQALAAPAVDDLIAAVKASGTTGASGMQRGLSEMDALQTGLNLAQADAGTDLNILDLQNNVLEDTKLNLKTVLSKSEDLDMTAAITQMQKQLMSLEAAQSSFAMISELTLFSYLR